MDVEVVLAGKQSSSKLCDVGSDHDLLTRTACASFGFTRVSRFVLFMYTELCRWVIEELIGILVLHHKMYIGC